MRKFFQSPLAGSPDTWEERGPTGGLAFRIKARAETPVLRLIADKAAPVVALPYGLYAFYMAPSSLEGYATAIAIWAAGWLVIRLCLRGLLSRTTPLEMDEDTISVRRWWGWQHFDRRIEHSFEIGLHDWAQWEWERHELAQRKAGARGKVMQPTKYFQKSFHIVLRHAGQRRDLVTVFGNKKAAAIRDRLEYCDRRLNDASGMAGGMGEKPGNDWKDTAGGL